MKPPARLAFVSPRYSSGATVGGAETLLRNLAVRAAASGFDVTFLTTCATNHFTWTNDRREGSEDSGRSAGDRHRHTPSLGRSGRNPDRSTEETPKTWHREANHDA